MSCVRQGAARSLAPERSLQEPRRWPAQRVLQRQRVQGRVFLSSF